MFKGKYLAGMLTAYIAVFVLCFYFAISPFLHICAMAVCLLVCGLSILLQDRRIVRDRKRIFLLLLAIVLLVFSFGYSEWFVRTNLNPISERIDGKPCDIVASVEEKRMLPRTLSAFLKLMGKESTAVRFWSFRLQEVFRLAMKSRLKA